MAEMTMEGTRMPKDDKVVFGLFRRIYKKFGEVSGDEIVRTIVHECGGLRVSIPDHQDLYRIERDRKIRALFNGANHRELSLMFHDPQSGLHLTVRQVRRILNEREP